jgi:hypothetical protein
MISAGAVSCASGGPIGSRATEPVPHDIRTNPNSPWPNEPDRPAGLMFPVRTNEPDAHSRPLRHAHERTQDVCRIQTNPTPARPNEPDPRRLERPRRAQAFTSCTRRNPGRTRIQTNPSRHRTRGLLAHPASGDCAVPNPSGPVRLVAVELLQHRLDGGFERSEVARHDLPYAPVDHLVVSVA